MCLRMYLLTETRARRTYLSDAIVEHLYFGKIGDLYFGCQVFFHFCRHKIVKSQLSKVKKSHLSIKMPTFT